MPDPKYYNGNIISELVTIVTAYGPFLGGRDPLMEPLMKLTGIQGDSDEKKEYLSDDPQLDKESVITDPENVRKISDFLYSLYEKTCVKLAETDAKNEPYTHAMLSVCSSMLLAFLSGSDISLPQEAIRFIPCVRA